MVNQVWLITRSSRGFGRAFVSAALKAGDSAVATARRLRRLAEFTGPICQSRASTMPVTWEATASQQQRGEISAPRLCAVSGPLPPNSVTRVSLCLATVAKERVKWRRRSPSASCSRSTNPDPER